MVRIMGVGVFDEGSKHSTAGLISETNSQHLSFLFFVPITRLLALQMFWDSAT